MSVACSDMLDFAQLRTPPEDGDVLVVPAPATMTRWTRKNHAALSAASVDLSGKPLSVWRTETRTALTGGDEHPVIVLGHQPEFIHPGVWAKHVVAQRMAQALGGVAVNLIVDNDAPRHTALTIPTPVDGAIALRRIPTVESRPGYAYEQLSMMPLEAVRRFDAAVREALADRYDSSLMPVFIRGLEDFAAANGASCGGWVDQHVAARRRIERTFGIELCEHRVSHIGPSPLLAEILRHAERFRAVYNRALAAYRRETGVRGRDRPIPDLTYTDDAVEVPVWVYRRCEARRRLFVQRQGRHLHLLADRDRIGVVSDDEISDGVALSSRLEALGGWQIRPRALTLTLWARLLLGDLFIHGIGGAKYDRITDEIIRGYFGLEPPRMACVSATLLLELPRPKVGETQVRALEYKLRDIRFNPQRHLEPNAETASLFEQRAEAVRQAQMLRERDPHNRSARRAAFRRIRTINAAILDRHRNVIDRLAQQLAEARTALAAHRLASGREYFFGLHSERNLRRLMDALPPQAAFTV